MAFAVDARVKCTDESCGFRSMLGTVMSVVGDDHEVRIDGFPAAKTAPLRTDQLRTTTLACPLDYSESE